MFPGRLSRVARVVLACVVTLIASSALASPALATHGRYFNISWKRTAINKADITVTAAYRCGYFFGGTTNCGTVGQTVSPGDQLTFGDGQYANPPLTIVSSSTSEGYLIGRATVSHTYGTPANSYTVGFQSCCSLSTLKTNADGSYGAASVLNLARGSGSPITSLPPVITIGREPSSFTIPATDPDGRTLRYRLAVSGSVDCGGCTTANPPGLAVNQTTGVVSWNTTAVDAGTYYTSYVIEALDATGAVAATTTASGLITVSPTSTNRPPTWTATTAADGTQYTLAPGRAFSVTLGAADPDAADTVRIAHLGLPSGASFTSTDGNTASGTLSWTPTVAQAGDYLVVFTEQDGRGLSGASRTFRLKVLSATAPTVTITDPVNGSAVRSLTPAISGAGGFAAGDEATATVVVRRGAATVATFTPDVHTTTGAWTVPAAAWAAADVALQEGEYTVTATQRNTIAAASGTATSTFTVDVTPPALDVVRPRDGARYSSDKDVLGEWTCQDVPSGPATCPAATIDGAPVTQGSALPRTPGTHSFTITATDAAGNTTTSAGSYRTAPFGTLLRESDPIAYYRLGDDTLADASGHGHHGDFKNASESRPYGISGDGDHARHFFGAGGYGYANGIAAPLTASTVLAWVRLDDARDSSILDHGYENALFVRDGRFVFRHMGTEISGGPAVTTGRWYLVAGVWDGDALSLWTTDGTQAYTDPPTRVATGSNTKRPSGVSTFFVGYGQDEPWLDGDLDEVAYFGRALTAGELAELWLADPAAVPAPSRERGGEEAAPAPAAASGAAESPAPAAVPAAVAAAPAPAATPPAATLSAAQKRALAKKKALAKRRALARRKALAKKRALARRRAQAARRAARRH